MGGAILLVTQKDDHSFRFRQLFLKLTLHIRRPSQAGLALDPKNSALETSLAAAKEGQETDRRERWRKAAEERNAEEERLKLQDTTKAKAKADASTSTAADAANTGEAGPSGDPLSSFFSELEGEREKVPPQKVERVLHDKYTNQRLGRPKEQMDRLLQHNYKWKNLNAFEVLELGSDATVEDIKQRYTTMKVRAVSRRRLYV